MLELFDKLYRKVIAEAVYSSLKPVFVFSLNLANAPKLIDKDTGEEIEWIKDLPKDQEGLLLDDGYLEIRKPIAEAVLAFKDIILKTSTNIKNSWHIWEAFGNAIADIDAPAGASPSFEDELSNLVDVCVDASDETVNIDINALLHGLRETCYEKVAELVKAENNGSLDAAGKYDLDIWIKFYDALMKKDI